MSLPLRQILQDEIQKAGFITFRRFMELALYCPESGYYHGHIREIGKRGDFYTSVSVGPLFGELLAFQFAQWLEHSGEPHLNLVEAGAHNGQLALDILTWFQKQRPELLQHLTYWIIEPSSALQQKQSKTLEKFAAQVRSCESLQCLTAFTGILFSNELLDAFPVSRFAWDAHRHEWFEWGVTATASEFVWHRIYRPNIEADLHRAGLTIPEHLLNVLPNDYTIDISFDAAEWWRQAATILRTGKLLTIDYGLTADQTLAPERPQGTLRAYHQHHLVLDPLAHPGEQDLTAHVNFTSLQHIGHAAGLQTEQFVSQEQFLTRIAEHAWKPNSNFGPWTPETFRQFQTLTHPNHLGCSFKVLVQSKR